MNELKKIINWLNTPLPIANNFIVPYWFGYILLFGGLYLFCYIASLR